MTQEEKHLIDRYIENSLTGVELKEFIDKLEADEDFKKKVSFHNLLIEGIQAAEDKRLLTSIEKSLRYKKPVVPFALKLIVTFLFVTLGGIILWDYIGPGSTGEHHNYFSMDLFRNKKQIQNQDISRNKETVLAESSYKDKSVLIDNASLNDTLAENTEEVEEVDSADNHQSDSPEIIVKKDQLVITYELRPIEIAHESSGSNSGSETASNINSEKQNSDIVLPDNYLGSFGTYTVEFWVSPINYKGYQLMNDKLVLFGIERPAAVVLFREKNKLWMRYDNNFYFLEPGEHFESFVVLNEIPTSLK